MSPRRAVLGLVMVVLLPACTTTSTDSGSFDLFEYGIIGPAELAPSTDAVVATNSGEFAHSLVVTDEAGTVVAATSLIDPGGNVEMTLSLEPGTYSFTCRIVVERPDGTISDHYEQGMSTTVSVTG